MGWTGTLTDAPAHQVVTEEIEFGGGHTVIARSGKYYAVRVNKTGEVYGLVALVKRKKEGWIYTKLVDEGMGPHEAKCPAKVLDLLSPTDNEYALRWREVCRANLELSKAAPKVKMGDTVMLSEPIKFADGVAEDRFFFVKRYTFKRMGDGQYVRMPKSWKTTYEYIVVT